jgi:Tfp pilus assembly protein PilN
MTRINLMPSDLRRAESTPLRVLLPVIAAVVVVVAVGFGWAFLRFGKLETARSELETAKSELGSLEPRRKYVEALKDELAEFKTREQTIRRSIASSRVLWTRKLDQLFDVATSDNGGQDYLLWIDTLEVRPPQATNAKKGVVPAESMRIKGWCFAERNPLENFNTFHRKLRESAFYADFADIPNPAGKAEELDGALRPKTAWTVDLTLPMKPREEKKTNTKTGALAEQADRAKTAPR